MIISYSSMQIGQTIFARAISANGFQFALFTMSFEQNSHRFEKKKIVLVRWIEMSI